MSTTFFSLISLLPNEVSVFQVGGSVRDRLMNRIANDVDYCMLGVDFSSMVQLLKEAGYEILLPFDKDIEKREKLYNLSISGQRLNASETSVLTNTVKARDKSTFEVVDFVLARSENDDDYLSSTGRYPLNVTLAKNIEEDLSRRDFTCNAMAINIATQELIDPFNGFTDIKNRTLNWVGQPEDRLMADPLRYLRFLRFKKTLNFNSSFLLAHIFDTEKFFNRFEQKVSADRILQELNKIFKADPLGFYNFLQDELDPYNRHKFMSILGRKKVCLHPTLLHT